MAKPLSACHDSQRINSVGGTILLVGMHGTILHICCLRRLLLGRNSKLHRNSILRKLSTFYLLFSSPPRQILCRQTAPTLDIFRAIEKGEIGTESTHIWFFHFLCTHQFFYLYPPFLPFRISHIMTSKYTWSVFTFSISHLECFYF